MTCAHGMCNYLLSVSQFGCCLQGDFRSDELEKRHKKVLICRPLLASAHGTQGAQDELRIYRANGVFALPLSMCLCHVFMRLLTHQTKSRETNCLFPIFKVVCGTSIIRACLIPMRNFSLGDLDGFETRIVPLLPRAENMGILPITGRARLLN
ncbi:hypothetical protein EUGRSUZ_C01678 [Eucalyptus grandis]|uniref:Uncharacterized protein n=2 Tax=Eucalyptus grandis TaxID=71139 RepID=A0ACC3LF15_EUCGR|nr:hypothetical protein EUGRSUZ_C01678 [Eucalyptus grandis]